MRTGTRAICLLVCCVMLGGPALAQRSTRKETPKEGKEINPWKEYIYKMKWRDGEEYFQREIVTACSGDKMPSFKEIGSLYYPYNICRYLRHIERSLLSEKERDYLMGWLVRNKEFNEELLLAIKPKDDVPRVFEIVDLLRRKKARSFKRYEQLSIAFAVVWDGFNRNDTLLLDSFSHLVDNPKYMAFDLRAMPYDVLKYVVDSQRPIEERQWAMRSYGRTSDLTKVYLKPPYDMQHLTYGKPKKIEEHPYTLKNIAKYGGVCHDRAVFASEVAKAAGRPAVYLWGSTESGVTHAWIGYLRKRGRSYVWDLDSGRVGDAETAVGRLREPQEYVVIDEGELELALLALRLRSEQRRMALVWCNLADILLKADAKLAASKAMDASLSACLCDRSQWRTLAALARAGVLSPKDVEKLINDFKKKLKDYPSLAVDVFEHMVATLGEKESKLRLELYDEMARAFPKNPELVGRIRLSQARYLEETGKQDEALKTYTNAVAKVIECRDVAIPLLDNATRLLLKNKKLKQAIALNKTAYYRTPSLKSDVHAMLTTRFAVGLRWAKLCKLAGDKKAHDRLLKSICSHVRGDRKERDSLFARLAAKNYSDINTTTAP